MLSIYHHLWMPFIRKSNNVITLRYIVSIEDNLQALPSNRKWHFKSKRGEALLDGIRYKSKLQFTRSSAFEAFLTPLSIAVAVADNRQLSIVNVKST